MREIKKLWVCFSDSTASIGACQTCSQTPLHLLLFDSSIRLHFHGNHRYFIEAETFFSGHVDVGFILFQPWISLAISIESVRLPLWWFSWINENVRIRPQQVRTSWGIMAFPIQLIWEQSEQPRREPLSPEKSENLQGHEVNLQGLYKLH